jgi:hypothetical protein
VAPAPPTAAPPAPGAQPAAADPAVLLKELNAIVPQVKQVIAVAPEKRDPLLKLVGKIKADAQGGRLRIASTGLQVLKKALAGISAAVAIVKELNGLVPRVKQAIAAAPQKRGAYLKLVEKIKTDAQGGRTPVAAAGLKGLKRVLGTQQAASGG